MIIPARVYNAGNANLRKKNGWGLRWTNTLSYDFTLGKIHRLNILAGHEVSDSGGDGLKSLRNLFPCKLYERNAFAIRYQFLFKCFYAEPYPFFLWSLEL